MLGLSMFSYFKNYNKITERYSIIEINNLAKASYIKQYDLEKRRIVTSIGFVNLNESNSSRIHHSIDSISKQVSLEEPDCRKQQIRIIQPPW